MRKLVQLDTNQRFGENIRWHILCSTVIERDDAVVISFANVVVSDSDVFGARMKGCILDQFNGGLVV
jgi:uncharacterized protein YggL (DUF469 family)